MIKTLLLVAVAILVIGAGSLVYFAAPYVETPNFVVTNESDVSVEVTAHWREQSKSLGSIPARSELVFEINDEAAMEFRAVYPNGLVITSSPAVYFTSGTTVTAVVTESAVEVSTEL